MSPSEHLEWHLDTHLLGRRVLVFPSLESTSSLALALADTPAANGLVVLAREQSAGRGQYGRAWHCPVDAGVLMSVVLFPPTPLSRPAILTAWAAVAVCETIQRLSGAQARLKWPNDVLVGGKKIAGILIEQNRATIAGIGLNLTQSTEMFQQANLPDATSLAAATGERHDWETAARLLIAVLDEEYNRLLGGNCAGLEARWQQHLGLVGCQVQMECLDTVLSGRLVQCAFSGLQLETNQGRKTVLPEKVRHLSEP